MAHVTTLSELPPLSLFWTIRIDNKDCWVWLSAGDWLQWFLGLDPSCEPSVMKEGAD